MFHRTPPRPLRPTVGQYRRLNYPVFRTLAYEGPPRPQVRGGPGGGDQGLLLGFCEHVSPRPGFDQRSLEQASIVAPTQRALVQG